ncbi:MAG: DUF3054 domain-containing protein [Chloroflexi bacterium]|nr:DUF3054 domain-containing protein [Chloroflexota bacterium]
MSILMKRYTPSILLIGDLIALLVFVLVGERQHELNQTNFITTALPFVVLWIIAGLLLGAFPQTAAVNARTIFGAAINAWLIVAPFGIFARALLLQSAVIPVSFFAAAAGFSGLFILAWRLIFFGLWRFIARREPQKQTI